MSYRTTALAWVAAAVLAGCASGGAQINSRATEAGLQPAKRLVLFLNAKSTHFTGALYTSFVGATQRKLQSCGVSVTTVEFDPMDLDMRQKLAQTLERVDPDTLLFFVRNGGNLVSGSGGVSGSLYFDTEASDKKKSKTLWKARIDYRILTRNLFADDNQSGERFASQYVARLAADKLVVGCPADVVTPKP